MLSSPRVGLTCSLIIATGLAVTLALAAFTPPAVQGSSIRIQNASQVDFHDVVVNDERYGDIPHGRVTSAQTMSPAFRYAAVPLIADGHLFEITPDDYFGERELGPGEFMYVLAMDKNNLEVRAELSRKAEGQNE